MLFRIFRTSTIKNLGFISHLFKHDNYETTYPIIHVFFINKMSGHLTNFTKLAPGTHQLSIVRGHKIQNQMVSENIKNGLLKCLYNMAKRHTT